MVLQKIIGRITTGKRVTLGATSEKLDATIADLEVNFAQNKIYNKTLQQKLLQQIDQGEHNKKVATAIVEYISQSHNHNDCKIAIASELILHQLNNIITYRNQVQKFPINKNVNTTTIAWINSIRQVCERYMNAQQTDVFIAELFDTICDQQLYIKQK